MRDWVLRLIKQRYAWLWLRLSGIYHFYLHIWNELCLSNSQGRYSKSRRVQKKSCQSACCGEATCMMSFFQTGKPSDILRYRCIWWKNVDYSMGINLAWIQEWLTNYGGSDERNELSRCSIKLSKDRNNRIFQLVNKWCQFACTAPHWIASKGIVIIV